MKIHFIFALLLLYSYTDLKAQEGIDSENWYEHTGTNNRLSLFNEGKTINWVRQNIDSIKNQGFQMLEVFAPWNSTHVYSGLAMTDFYTINPSIGTLNDLKALINETHEKGMKITVFLNLGYSSTEAPFFLKACDDAKNGTESSEKQWYIFADNNLTNPTIEANSYFLQQGYWVYSNRAGKYYWSKWDDQPQFNFSSLAWQNECKKIIRFYMDLGFDGMVVDAVNFYTNITWEINNQCITDVIREYPNPMIQPEGAGAFGDEPTGWIKMGHYNCIQNYRAGVWWDEWSIIWDAINTKNASIINTRIREYRDRIVAAGGISYFYPLWEKPLTTQQRMLETATIISTGNLFVQNAGGVYNNEMGSWSKDERLQYKKLLDAANNYPALHPSTQRSVVATNDDNSYFAQLRTSNENQRILSLLSFKNASANVTIHVSEAGIENGQFLRDIISGETFPVADNNISCAMTAWGYRFLILECQYPAIFLEATSCNNSAALNWQSCSNCCISYTIERKTGDNSFETLTTDLTENWYSDPTVLNDTEYCYRVSSTHSDSIIYSNEICITPHPVLTGTIKAVTDEGSVNLEWLPVTDALSYYIWRADTSLLFENIGVTRFTKYFDSPGQGKYQYYIVAADYCGNESDPSEILDVTVFPSTYRIIEDDDSKWTGSKEFAPLPQDCAQNGKTRVGWRYNDYTQYTFNGTKVKVYGTKFPQGKTADISLDGIKYPGISFYNFNELCGTLIWESPDLAPGNHTIQFIVKGDWIEIDYLKVITTEIISTSVNLNTTDRVLLYPNPTSQSFSLILPVKEGETVKIDITDLTGKILTSGSYQVYNSQVSINCASFRNGNYLVHIIAPDWSLVKKLIIQVID